ncbi:MAG: hypothetical protein IH876_02015, partial [Gemmatimonadetes bacterium]|nr:hypothetical protein [Gemmatimonadota bacterium]
ACSQVSQWNDNEAICTLTQDVFEPIQVESSNTTLDGAGHLVRVPSPQIAISIASSDGVSSLVGVTVRNCRVEHDFDGLVVFPAVSNSTIEANTFVLTTNAVRASVLLFGAGGGIHVRDNIFEESFGVLVRDTPSSVVTENSMSGPLGIRLSGSAARNNRLS